MLAGQVVTHLLQELADGDKSALEQLVPLVYAELHRMAASYLKRESPGHTLQATALVHEVYLKLAGANQPDYQSRAHFYGIASRIMRQILVDHARTRMTAKRGGREVRAPLVDAVADFRERPGFSRRRPRLLRCGTARNAFSYGLKRMMRRRCADCRGT